MDRSLRYSGVSTINHWITVLLVVAMLVLGLLADEAPSEDAEEYVLGAHISLGFFTLLFIVWRIAYRLYDGFQAPIADTATERWLAYIVQRALLFVLAIQVITGPLYLFTEGESLNVFGWFSIGLSLESFGAIHEPLEEVHEVVGVFVLPFLLSLHIAGAIKHYLTDEGTE
jgi:cytochrome b561